MSAKSHLILRFLRSNTPIVTWLPDYNRGNLRADGTAGVLVAIMLIPQSMAYALLAGLPPQAGLYASILPLFIYAVLGTSRVLVVGPVAIVSLMVASSLEPLAMAGSEQYTAHAITLALLCGIFLIALGLLRVGFLVNFMSHPVLAGFTSAVALIIGFSQFKHLLGLQIDSTHQIHEILWTAIRHSDDINLTTLAIAAGSLALLGVRNRFTRPLLRWGVISELTAELLPKAMPLLVVIIAITLTWFLGLIETSGVQVIGRIPMGLPALVIPSPDWSLWRELLPAAGLISLVGFLESISVAKSLASKRRRKVIPNQELVALGAANLGASFTGGFPVAGSISRSVVNHTAGACTPLATIITAMLIILTLLVFAPMLYFLPKAVLGSIIIFAIAALINFGSLRHTWAYNKADGFSYLATFGAVLALGPEYGIVVGIGVSLCLFIWRTSRPHIFIVGQIEGSETYRNILSHKVKTFHKLLLVRIDESLYFANSDYLEEQILRYITDHPDIEHFVLICSAVNEIDASALDTLEKLIEELRDAGVTMHLCELKDPVMNRLKRVQLFDMLAPGRVFQSTHDAVTELSTGRERQT